MKARDVMSWEVVSVEAVHDHSVRIEQTSGMFLQSEQDQKAQAKVS